MIRYSRIRFGSILVLVAVFLLIAGCIQQSGAGTFPTTPSTSPASLPATLNPDDVKNQVSSFIAPYTGEIDYVISLYRWYWATSLAAGYAREIDGQTLSTAIREGPDSKAFATILEQLRALKAQDSRIAFVYTVEQQNGTVRFLIDADYGLPEGSDFLSAYPDAADELKKPVTAPIAAGPYTDSWGTFISGYAPVDMGSDKTRVVLGVDFRL